MSPRLWLPWHLQGRMGPYPQCLYTYSSQCKVWRDHANADGLSWQPLEESPSKVSCTPEMVLLMDRIAAYPVSSNPIQKQTNPEPILSKVFRMVSQQSCLTSKTCSPSTTRDTKLSMEDGSLLRGSQVIVCKHTEVQKVVDQQHEGILLKWRPGMAVCMLLWPNWGFR